MFRTGPASSAILLAAFALVAGCADDKDDGEGARKTSTSPKAAAGLPGPIHPRCGTEGFAKPRVRRIPGEPPAGSLWSLSYTRTRPARAGEANTILLTQASPKSPRPSTNRPTTSRNIAGHRVTYSRPTKRHPFASANWKTRRATYAVITTGAGTTTVDELIRCLP